MVKNITQQNKHDFEWIDIVNPQEEELDKIGKKYNLHQQSVLDCLQSGHLPKHERFKGYTFIIIRVYDSEWDPEADTVQELTHKIAIFISDAFIITIHRKEWAPLDAIILEFLNEDTCKNPWHVLTEIVKKGLHSYDDPGTTINQSIEYYEKQVFLTERKVSMLKGLYFLKRKLDVIRRLLLLSHDIIDKIDPHDTSNAYTRDCRDLYVKQQSIYDSMAEQINHLLNIYFNISSQRTNETMRVLTIFSVFFMPLTFIVGVYGMNFQNMPELQWKWGYPATIVSMAVVTIVVYLWFRRKKWM